MTELGDRLVVKIGYSDGHQLAAVVPGSGETESLSPAPIEGSNVTDIAQNDDMLTLHFTDWHSESKLSGFTDGTLQGTYNKADRDSPLSIDRIQANDDGVFYAPASGEDNDALWFKPRGQGGRESLGAATFVNEVAGKASLGLWHDQLIYAAESADGRELWISDGTELGTRQLADLNPGPSSSDPTAYVPFEEFVYFIANDGMGRQLWVLDATGATSKQSDSSGDVLDFQFVANDLSHDVVHVYRTDAGFAVASLAGETTLLESENTISLTRSDDSKVFAIVGDESSLSSVYAWTGEEFVLLTTQDGTFRFVDNTERGYFFDLETPANGHSLWYTEGTLDSTDDYGRVGAFQHAVGTDDALLWIDPKGNVLRAADSEITTLVRSQTRTASSHVRSANQVADTAVFVVTNIPFSDSTAFTTPLFVSRGESLDPLTGDLLWGTILNWPRATTFFPFEEAAQSGYYFGVQNTDFQGEIWRTDLTPAGTRRLSSAEVAELLPDSELQGFNIESELAEIFEAPENKNPRTVLFNNWRVTLTEHNGESYFTDFFSSPSRIMRHAGGRNFEAVVDIPTVAPQKVSSSV